MYTMKIHAILLLLLVCAINPLTAQDSTSLKYRTFRITVYGPDKIITSGWLANITDSSVLVSSQPVRFGIPADIKEPPKPIIFTRLQTVDIKRKNGGTRGLLIGLASGFIIGAVIGLASGDDTEGFIRFSAGEKALAGGVLLGAVSGLAGVVVGAVSRKRFNLQGNKENLNQMRLRILESVSQKKL